MSFLLVLLYMTRVRRTRNIRLVKSKASGDGIVNANENSYQQVGDGISSQKRGWRFDGDVPKRFDLHVKKSIPGYVDGHDIVVQLAKPHLSQSGVCYELGCSTGTLTSKLASCSCPDMNSIIGLDQIDAMLEIAQEKCKEYSNVSFEQADILEYAFLPASVIVSYYTIQFIPPENRPGLVKKIYDAMEEGGVFILFEKIRFADAATDKRVTDEYYAFKKAQGFSEEEILLKAESLKDILTPQTEAENLQMLRAAGFSNIDIVFNQLCWQGYLAQK